jgi:hypothetical protein
MYERPVFSQKSLTFLFFSNFSCVVFLQPIIGGGSQSITGFEQRVFGFLAIGSHSGFFKHFSAHHFFQAIWQTSPWTPLSEQALRSREVITRNGIYFFIKINYFCSALTIQLTPNLSVTEPNIAPQNWRA